MKMDKRQKEPKQYLATAYENKVKGVMDDKTFVLLSNQFRKERDQSKKSTTKRFRQNLRPLRSSKAVSHSSRRRSRAKLTSIF